MRFLLQIWAMTISVDFYFLLNPSPTLWAAGLLTFKEYCLLARCCCSHFHISTGHKSVTRRIYFSSKLQFKSTQYFWDLNSNILRIPVFPTYCNNPVVPEILKTWSQAINWYHMNYVNQFYHDSQEFNLHINKKKRLISEFHQTSPRAGRQEAADYLHKIRTWGGIWNQHIHNTVCP